jgi:Putative Na+/H+ antiporter
VLHLLATAAGVPLPPPLDLYPALPGAGLVEVLSARARLVPFNLAATVVFLLAVLHTFAAQRFMGFAQKIQKRRDAQARAAGRAAVPSVTAGLMHLVGEVEVVFGLWAVVLVAVIVAFYDWPTAVAYLDGGVNFTEALFVVVIMALASSQPVLVLAERALARVAALGGGTPAAWWLTILTLAPLFGSIITEPAAMTIGALLLVRQFYALRPSRRLAYATLGALFVNVSVGGTLTHFAAPPVIMVARPWQWDTSFMLSHFGGKAVLGILLVNALNFFAFRGELRRLATRATERPPAGAAGAAMPGWLIAANLGFMVWTVANAHHPPLLVAGFLFFLGFAQATAAHQGSVDLKAPLLVGFFLASLVVHGTLQGWWIAPILAKLAAAPLFLGAAVLTAFNDNALVTYLATLVPGLSDAGRYAIVAGAVTGGGLTVIANAPNPAGQSILSPCFEGGILPLGLLAGASLPTLVFVAVFMLWQ